MTYCNQFVNYQGRGLLYPIILLLLSIDGKTISPVLGGANCRILGHD